MVFNETGNNVSFCYSIYYSRTIIVYLAYDAKLGMVSCWNLLWMSSFQGTENQFLISRLQSTFISGCSNSSCSSGLLPKEFSWFYYHSYFESKERERERERESVCVCSRLTHTFRTFGVWAPLYCGQRYETVCQPHCSM